MEKEKNIKSIIITKSSNSQKPLVQLEKLSKYGKKNNNTEQNNKKQIKLPIHYTSKCIKRLEPLINTKMKEEIAKMIAAILGIKKYYKCSYCKILDSMNPLNKMPICQRCHQPLKEISEMEYKQKVEMSRKYKEERTK